ncbi:hypothetical protein QTP70_002375 [Hemibagrus guttatus]|uniref:Ig-like domain-containing protein n=1 Tax=Hemibagrus guttatus TaxID=175788 RepID=A0AAE0UGZ2_9TELE|nr:hypothetical protein QTP70_002375 [Hemibagrus guttatus]
MLFLFVVFFTLADVAEAADNSIKPDQTNVFSMEGSNISLSCTYTGSVNSLHWYRQKPGSRPEFLLLIDESGQDEGQDFLNGDSMADSIEPLVTHKVVDESDSMADSIKPLLTHKAVDEGSFADKIGPKDEDANIVRKETDTVTLKCSYESSSGYVWLYWYKQYPNSAPQFLLYKGDSMADPIEPLFTHKVVDEGDDVTLSCKHESSAATTNYLHWVPREELWYCMRKSGVAEKYVRVVQDMYERSRTVVSWAVGQTEEFKVEVGLHQGSVLGPFLFAIVMDQLSEEVRQESP